MGKLQSFVETENMPHLDGVEACLYREESPSLVPDWSVLMQMRTWNPYSLIQKALSWLIGMELLWLVNKDINEAIAGEGSLIGRISNLGALLWGSTQMAGVQKDLSENEIKVFSLWN